MPAKQIDKPENEKSPAPDEAGNAIDREIDAELDEALKESFPASDPASISPSRLSESRQSR